MKSNSGSRKRGEQRSKRSPSGKIDLIPEIEKSLGKRAKKKSKIGFVSKYPVKEGLNPGQERLYSALVIPERRKNTNIKNEQVNPIKLGITTSKESDEDSPNFNRVQEHFLRVFRNDLPDSDFIELKKVIKIWLADKLMNLMALELDDANEKALTKKVRK